MDILFLSSCCFVNTYKCRGWIREKQTSRKVNALYNLTWLYYINTLPPSLFVVLARSQALDSHLRVSLEFQFWVLAGRMILCVHWSSRNDKAGHPWISLVSCSTTCRPIVSMWIFCQFSFAMISYFRQTLEMVNLYVLLNSWKENWLIFVGWVNFFVLWCIYICANPTFSGCPALLITM